MRLRPQDLAIIMLGGNPNVNFLHVTLYEAITRADELTNAAHGDLFSRQAIAAIIVAWELANPNAKALHP